VGGTPNGPTGGAGGCDPTGTSACACGIGHLVISEVRSRGVLGALDEFVELYNPTAAAVTLDASWAIEGKNATSASSVAYSTRWLGGGGVIPAHGHFLIVGSSYAQNPPADEYLKVSITDAASLRLMQNGNTVDAVCYYFDQATLDSLMSSSFTCEGTPVSNLPHNDAAGDTGNVDVSIERAPGGSRGNCTDTGNNLTDFVSASPATPQDAASPLTP
jgi:hypothetical protein